MAEAGSAISTTALILDLARGAAIATAATLAAAALLRLVERRWVVVLLAAWVAVPALAVAHAWALPAALLPHPLVALLLHLVLASLRLAPVALLIVCCVPPPPLDARAFHCLRLGPPAAARLGRWPNWWGAGPGRRWLVTALLIFPLAFGEFELGSRLALGTWAVRLFDAQAGGQFLSTTLL